MNLFTMVEDRGIRNGNGNSEVSDVELLEKVGSPYAYSFSALAAT